MTEPHPDLPKIAAAINEVAKTYDLHPSEVSRTLFRVHFPELVNAQAARRWNDAKALAAGDSLPMQAIPEGHTVKGVSSYVDRDGRTKGQWVKTVRLEEDPAELMARLVERMGSAPARPPVPAPAPGPGAEEHLAVYPLGDMHLGMYAAARESGEDWDTTKAIAIAQAAIDDLTTRGVACGMPADTALLINVGDFFHADGPDNRTPKSGHSLDVDGRYFEIMEGGLALKVYMVDRLLQTHAQVRVWTRVGNHDAQTSLSLAIALRAWYRDEPRVTIDYEPSAADYLRFGSVLIGCTHGDSYTASKPEAMIATMACDRPEDWGRTVHRYWYVGHVHHRSVKEGKGGIVETFRTLAPKDAWHAREGYRAGRDMNRILIHYRDGEVSRLTTSIGRLRS